MGCVPVTFHLCCGSKLLEGRSLYGVHVARLSAQSPGVFGSLSPTHAPWLLAHKIQSPQEKEALHALTVSLALSFNSPVLSQRAGPQSHFRVVGSLIFTGREKAGRREGGPWLPILGLLLESSTEPALGEGKKGFISLALYRPGLAS